MSVGRSSEAAPVLHQNDRPIELQNRSIRRRGNQQQAAFNRL